MRVCLVATELFHWGRYGGFGKATRMIGAGLAERGIDVSVVVPRGENQEPVENLDGMTVYGFPLYKYPFTAGLYRRCDADIYHSQEPSWGTIKAMEAMPGRRHVATCQNPKTRDDWRLVNRFYPLRRRVFNALMEPTIRGRLRRVDAVYCQARYIIPKVQALYNLSDEPGFLPNPVEVPKTGIAKSEEPMVCFLGRFDGEKQPELFFELARRFPGVRFVAMGRAHSEALDRRLRERYGGVGNLELLGFTTGAEKERVLGEAWVLVNTSVSECLPVSFLEAAAHRCAILSFHDPDGFASRYGYHAWDGDLDAGLRTLLVGDAWRLWGEGGLAYVKEVHEVERVVDRHIAVYESLLEG